MDCRDRVSMGLTADADNPSPDVVLIGMLNPYVVETGTRGRELGKQTSYKQPRDG